MDCRHQLLSDPGCEVEVPALSIAKASAVAGALIRRERSAEMLIEADPELSEGRCQTRLILFQRLVEERLGAGEAPITPEDGMALVFCDLLTLLLAEGTLTERLEAAGGPDRELEVAREQIERLLYQVENRFFEAAVPFLIEGKSDSGDFILKLEPRVRSEEHLVEPALRGMRTLVSEPELRVRRVTGFSSIEALGKHISTTEASVGLSTCQVIVDTGCDQSCFHCFLGPKRPLLGLERLERLLNEELPGAGLDGRLYFSEPFNRTWRGHGERLERLIRLLDEHQPWLVLSNGQAIDDEVLELLERSGRFRLYLGLLGASAETHERITRKRGSFEQLMENIDRIAALRDRRTTLCFNVLIHRDNLEELSQMLEIAVEHGAASVFLSTLYPVPTSPPSLVELCLGEEERRRLVASLGVLRRELKGSLHVEVGGGIGVNFHTKGIFRYLHGGLSYCQAGRSMVALHPVTGKLYPCMKLTAPQFEIGYWDEATGRPVIDPERNVLARLTREPGLLKGVCSPERCLWSPICRGGCRAVAAFYSEGDLLAEQPFCLTRTIDGIESPTPR